ncbi:MAG: hypothetical protein IV089_01650 [Thiobacillus sp.]|nr:hypothetical protein [Thiobacillus sp.]
MVNKCNGMNRVQRPC